MNFFYAYRGWVLGVFALALLLLPGTPFSSDKLQAALPLFAACFLGAVFLRIQTRRSIGEHTRGFFHDADRLVMEGVYSKIRHPLYLSNTGVGCSFILLHLGFCLRTVPFAIVLIVFEVLLSKAEDRYLESRFGDLWRNWACMTPAFIPRLARKIPEMSGQTEIKRSVGQAFSADASTWIWLVLFIAIIFLRKTCWTFDFFS